ncbi:AAA family ATPase [Marinospirillum sp.]|uniref:AAA family ATPase n=1 Tax=Marinospirillum sp. TaxID=2183934 RepID=UPI00286FD581|nr:AAA family ATPase [Marinospirillum sp.]MDR9468168.1 zeta toxin family protein [Marinospirillum sp.]
MKTCWIIAGPNGAGKTTFAMNYLPGVARDCHFINADLIAAGLSPLAPERELVAASRLFLREVESAIEKETSFAIETTLAGRTYLKLVQRLQSQGWKVILVYLALPSVEMSRQRVAERVRHGGHDIPAKAIERRFPRSLRNLLLEFSYRADECSCFMNARDEPESVFDQVGKHRKVLHREYFDLLCREAEL